MAEDIEGEIITLANRLQQLLEEHLLEDPEIAEPFIIEAKNIIRNINRYGYLVEWRASLNPETLALEVIVDVKRPKDNMTPEDAKIYDEWFMEVNKIESEIQKGPP